MLSAAGTCACSSVHQCARIARQAALSRTGVKTVGCEDETRYLPWGPHLFFVRVSDFVINSGYCWLPRLVQDHDEDEAAMKLTAVPVALVRPAIDSDTAALEGGTAFPVVASSDEEDALHLLQDSLQTAISATPALEGALPPWPNDRWVSIHDDR